MHEIDRREVDDILCLGDIVGYGPHPVECVEMVMDRGITSVMGNHDACVVGLLSDTFFAEPNRSLLRWTRTVLGNEHLAWMERMPMTIDGWLAHRIVQSATKPPQPEHVYSFKASHASPQHPDKWEWLDSAIRCRELLSVFAADFIFVGHTHVPALIANELGVFGFESGYRYLINPGSVGQSRDHDKRASYAILDTNAFTCNVYRIDYDIRSTKSALYEMGYSEVEVRRLLNV